MKVINVSGQIKQAGGGGAGSVNISGGTTSNNLTNLVFADAGGVSFGLAGSTITAVAGTAAPSPIVISAGTSSASISSLVFSNSNGISFGLNGSTITGSHNGLTTVALSLNELLPPSADATWLMNTRQIQFQWGVNASNFTTAANRKGFFEIDVAMSDNTLHYDVLHIHQSTGNPDVHLLHLQADGTNAIPLHIEQSGAVGIEINRPISFDGGSVPLILGTSQSNVVSNLNAFYLQGRESSEFLTTAMASNRGSDFVQATAAFAGTSASGTINSTGISVSVGPYITTAMLSNAVTLSNIRVSAGTTSNLLSAITFANGSGVSFGLNASTLTASVAAQSAQSAIMGLGASNTGNTAGNTGLSTGIDWVLAGSNNITISESTAGGGPNTLWISGPTVGGAQTGISGIANSQTTYTSGTVSLSDQANITIASSVNGATQIYKFSVAAQSVQTQGITVDQLSLGLSTGGNTQGNTTVQTGQRFVLVGTNGITLSQATGAGSTTISISGNAAQTTQPAVNALGVSNTGNTLGNTGTSSGITWVLAGSGGITASQSTAGGGPNTVWLSVPTGASATGNLGAIAINALTTYTSGTVVFSNSNGITFGTNAQTVTASHNALTSQSNQQMTMFATGNTTLSSTGTNNASSLVFMGSGAASVGITNGSILIDVAAGAAAITQSIGMSTQTAGGGTGGTTGYVTGDDILYHFVPGSNITMSQSLNGASGTLSIYGPAAGAGVTLSGSQPYANHLIVERTWAQGSLFLNQWNPGAAVQFDNFVMPISHSNASNSSGSATLSYWFGFYSRNVSTLSLYASSSFTTGVTGSGTVGNYSLKGGQRNLAMPWTTTIPSGNWWIAVNMRSTTAGANMSYGLRAASVWASTYSGWFGSASDASNQSAIGVGIYSATTSGLPSAISITQIQGGSSAFQRQPAVMFVSSPI